MGIGVSIPRRIGVGVVTRRVDLLVDGESVQGYTSPNPLKVTGVIRVRVDVSFVSETEPEKTGDSRETRQKE